MSVEIIIKLSKVQEAWIFSSSPAKGRWRVTSWRVVDGCGESCKDLLRSWKSPLQLNDQSMQVKETHEVGEELPDTIIKETHSSVSGHHVVSLQIKQKIGRGIKGMFCLGKNNQRLSTAWISLNVPFKQHSKGSNCFHVNHLCPRTKLWNVYRNTKNMPQTKC